MGSIPKRYLVSSALPYANGALHLGHLAGAYLPADIYVRYMRGMGKDIVWVCGSDEHGAAITIRAKKENISPKTIIDKYHELNKSTFQKFGISFDIYHRTSEPIHHETALEFFAKLVQKGGEFDVKESEQYYDEDYDQFLADRYIKGTCPKCGHTEAYGDQCENCGSDLSPTELIEPVSTLSGKKPTLRTTRHWYFRLDKHQAWLKEWLDKGTIDGVPHHDPKKWKKHVLGQCRSWIEDGLKPRSITRDLDWGIQIPDIDEKGKVLYVWFDAPIGYISATKQWALDHGKNWEDYWKSDDAQLIHFIGKDNIVFHCIVFPAMLKAYGEFNLPINVPANQFLNFEGDKFSKSRGWGLAMHEYLNEFKDFPNQVDAMRYALTRNMPETKDSDFKWDEFVEFHDNELVANLGNFVNRVVVLTNKYYDGVVPEVTESSILEKVSDTIQRWQGEITDFNFRNAILALMEVSSIGNTYLQDVSPWAIWKTDPDSQEVKNCLGNCLAIVQLLSAMMKPFLPSSSDKLRSFLQLSKIGNGDILKSIEQPMINPGHQIGSPELLFAKINDRKDASRKDIIEGQKNKLATILESETPNHVPVKDEISFDDFSKLDFRTGKVLQAEKVPKSDKLLKLSIDLGFEQRTILSGIAK
ncbi:MAG: methionine--tRNA ligase, partial [Bacteroidia bacterium]|nr:methionine--tRNA ligase [Bacteroidia bacterium]